MDKKNLPEFLKDCVLTEILNHNLEISYICFLGEKLGKKLVLKMKKKEYESQAISQWQDCIKSIIDFQLTFDNDIYSKYTLTNFIKSCENVEIIYPADEKIIERNRKKQFHLFIENFDFYLKEIKPRVDKINITNSSLKWIYNILFENKEELIFKNDEFVICKDYKFTNKDIFYYLGIPFTDKIRSLRDLNETHLPLLESFYFKGRKAAAEYSKIPESKIRVFIHYYPTFYYFHVHYVHIDLENPSLFVNRAIELYSVIQNISMKKDYYQTIEIECYYPEDFLKFNLV